MRRYKKLPLWMKIVLCISIVGSGMLLLYHGSALNLYLQIIQRHKLEKIEFIGKGDLYSAYIMPEILAAMQNLFFAYKTDDAIPAVRLDLPAAEEKKLNDDLPESGFHWVDGTLTIDGVEHAVKVKYAGDYFKNWMYYKKGYRINPKKEDDTLFLGYTMIDVRIPKYPYANTIAQLLGEKMGLLAQERQAVQFYLQNEFVGLMYIQPVIGKDFLEKNQYMAGDLYQGENGTTDIYDGVDRNIFTVPQIWEAKTQREDGADTRKQDIFLLINAVQTVLSGGKITPMRALMDEKKTVSFLALVTLTQSLHFDFFHNTILYFDPTKGSFEQVVKDVGPWAWDTFAVDIVNNDLFLALHKDPRFVFEKYRVIWAQITQAKLADWLRTTIAETLTLREETVKNDPGLSNFSDAMALLETEFNKLDTLAQMLATTEVYYKQKSSDTETVLTIAVSGWGSVLLVDTGARDVYRDHNMNGVLDGEDQKVTLPELLHPGRVLPIDAITLEPSPLTYQYIVVGGMVQPPTLENGLDGSAVIPVEDETIVAAPLTYPQHYLLQQLEQRLISVHPWLLEAEEITADDFTIFSDDPLKFSRIGEKFASRDAFLAANPAFTAATDGADGVKLSGRVTFDRTVVIPKDVPLTVEAGTTIALGPNVSVIAYGPVTIVGTAEKPVRFERSNTEIPWGTFAVLGDQTQSVTIRYTSFDGGKDGFMNGAYFSGMVSLYWLKDVAIDHAIFTHAASDDALNVKYTEMIITNSFFLENTSDAIDSDFNKATVTQNTFDSNGGDGVDVSGTTAIIAENLIQNSGDKGISIGEESVVDLQTTWIDGGITGVAVKDASTVTIQNVHIFNTTNGIALYRKKALYEKGGTATVSQTNFWNNTRNTDSDDYSKFTMNDITNNEEMMPALPALPF